MAAQNVHPEVNMYCIYGEVSMWSQFPRSMYVYATFSDNLILDHLKLWPAHTVAATAVLKVKKKIIGNLRWTDFCLKELYIVGFVGNW